MESRSGYRFKKVQARRGQSRGSGRGPRISKVMGPPKREIMGENHTSTTSSQVCVRRSNSALLFALYGYYYCLSALCLHVLDPSNSILASSLPSQSLANDSMLIMVSMSVSQSSFRPSSPSPTVLVLQTLPFRPRSPPITPNLPFSPSP